MGAEEGGFHPHIARGGDPAGDAQHLDLGVDVEPVARLDLDDRDTLGDQRIGAGQGIGQQIVLGRVASGGDGRDDPAAGARHLFVARPIEAHLEFARAVAAKDDMGVTVYQGGGDQTALHVLTPFGQVRWQIGLRPDPADLSVVVRDRAVLDEAISPFAGHRGNGRVP